MPFPPNYGHLLFYYPTGTFNLDEPGDPYFTPGTWSGLEAEATYQTRVIGLINAAALSGLTHLLLWPTSGYYATRSGEEFVYSPSVVDGVVKHVLRYPDAEAAISEAIHNAGLNLVVYYAPVTWIKTYCDHHFASNYSEANRNTALTAMRDHSLAFRTECAGLGIDIDGQYFDGPPSNDNYGHTEVPDIDSSAAYLEALHAAAPDLHVFIHSSGKPFPDGCEAGLARFPVNGLLPFEHDNFGLTTYQSIVNPFFDAQIQRSVEHARALGIQRVYSANKTWPNNAAALWDAANFGAFHDYFDHAALNQLTATLEADTEASEARKPFMGGMTRFDLDFTLDTIERVTVTDGDVTSQEILDDALIDVYDEADTTTHEDVVIEGLHGKGPLKRAPITMAEDDDQVATYADDGVGTPVGDGETFVTVGNGYLTKSIAVEVASATGVEARQFNRYIPGSLARHMTLQTTLDDIAQANHTGISTTSPAIVLFATDGAVAPKSQGIRVGQRVVFLDGNAAIVTATVTDKRDIAERDLSVLKLSSAGLTAVKKMRTPPAGFRNYIPGVEHGVPIAVFADGEDDQIGNWISHASSTINHTGTSGAKVSRFAYINNELVLLSVGTDAYAGDALPDLIDEIDAAMSQMGSSSTVQTVGLAGFLTNYTGEAVPIGQQPSGSIVLGGLAADQANSGTFTALATVTPPAGKTVSNVIFEIQKAGLAVDTETVFSAPFEWEIVSTLFANGDDYTIRARAFLSDASSLTITVPFEIDNVGGGQPPADVEIGSTRIDGFPADPASTTGTIFVDAKVFDPAGNLLTQATTPSVLSVQLVVTRDSDEAVLIDRTETSSPFALMSDSGGVLNGLNTTTLLNEAHTISVTAIISTDPTKPVTATLPFTVANVAVVDDITLAGLSSGNNAGTLNLTATVSGMTATSVTISVLGTSITSTDTSAPFTAQIDTRLLTNGLHTLRASATDGGTPVVKDFPLNVFNGPIGNIVNYGVLYGVAQGTWSEAIYTQAIPLTHGNVYGSTRVGPGGTGLMAGPDRIITNADANWQTLLTTDAFPGRWKVVQVADGNGNFPLGSMTGLTGFIKFEVPLLLNSDQGGAIQFNSGTKESNNIWVAANVTRIGYITSGYPGNKGLIFRNVGGQVIFENSRITGFQDPLNDAGSSFKTGTVAVLNCEYRYIGGDPIERNHLLAVEWIGNALTSTNPVRDDPATPQNDEEHPDSVQYGASPAPVSSNLHIKRFAVGSPGNSNLWSNGVRLNNVENTVIEDLRYYGGNFAVIATNCVNLEVTRSLAGSGFGMFFDLGNNSNVNFHDNL